MKKIDTTICLKKSKKALRNTKNIIAKRKDQHKKFCFFLFTQYKNGTKGLNFW